MAPKKVGAAAIVADVVVATATTDAPVVAPTAVSADIGVPVTKIEQPTSGVGAAVFGSPNGVAAASLPADNGRRRRSRGNQDAVDKTEKSDHKKNKKGEKSKDKNDKKDKKHKKETRDNDRATDDGLHQKRRRRRDTSGEHRDRLDEKGGDSDSQESVGLGLFIINKPAHHPPNATDSYASPRTHPFSPSPTTTPPPQPPLPLSIPPLRSLFPCPLARTRPAYRCHLFTAMPRSTSIPCTSPPPPPRPHNAAHPHPSKPPVLVHLSPPPRHRRGIVEI